MKKLIKRLQSLLLFVKKIFSNNSTSFITFNKILIVYYFQIPLKMKENQ